MVFSALNFLSLVIRMGFTFQLQRQYPHMGNLFPAFGGTGEGQNVLALAVSSVTLIKNNQYCKVAYLGAACPEPYQCLINTNRLL